MDCAVKTVSAVGPDLFWRSLKSFARDSVYLTQYHCHTNIKEKEKLNYTSHLPKEA